MKKKIIILTIIICTVIATYALGLQHYFSFTYIKSQKESFVSYYHAHPTLTVSAYFLIYILLTAVSFPGATAISLLGGALFGLWWGTLIVSFASTIGSAAAFLMSRYLFYDYVSKKYKDHLRTFNSEIKLRGKFYLLALRLNPVIPFFLINIIMGLTPMSLWEFYWVSQIGMVPGTILYVNAGAQLGKLQSLSEILSPAIFWSFLALSLVPLAMREITEYFRER